MHTRFRGLGLFLIGLWTFASVTAACGSDESSPATQADAAADSQPPTPPPGDGDGASATAADLVVYTGTPAALDASQSSGTSFAWTVKTVPNGSTVTTASLQGASTARPSFVPDVSGDYELEVTVGAGSVNASKTVKVQAVPAPVFYTLTNINDAAPYYEIRTVGMDGTGAHAVTCRQQNYDPDASSDGGESPVGGFLLLAMIQADLGLDWWEAPPGQPSRAAFQDFRYSPDGSTVSLAVGTTNSTCQNPPVNVRVIPNPLDAGSSSRQPAVYHPHFSPDGSRIAYIEQRSDGYFLATIGYDGKDYRQLAPLCSNTNDDCWEGDKKISPFGPSRPQWLDAQTVGWARTSATHDAGDGWEIMTATDSANPAPSRWMSCSGFSPFGFAFLKDGSVIANRRPVGAAQDLFVLKPAAPGGSCQVVRNLTNLPNTRSYARDFSLSKDQQKVAFVRHVDVDPAADAQVNAGGGEVYIADVNGTTPPAPLGSPTQAAFFGPRFIAEGAYVSFNGFAPLPDGSLQDAGIEEAGAFLDSGLPAIVVVPASGGAVKYAAVSNAQARTFILGGGNGGACGLGCAIGSANATAAGSAASLLVGVAFLARRRRRK